MTDLAQAMELEGLRDQLRLAHHRASALANLMEALAISVLDEDDYAEAERALREMREGAPPGTLGLRLTAEEAEWLGQGMMSQPQFRDYVVRVSGEPRADDTSVPARKLRLYLRIAEIRTSLRRQRRGS